MTGDGVNDILAMKEADVSLAIGEGADAARRSAKMVLLDSDFGGVPSIIAEGRQSINNLERSTTLFLSKTVYASILAVLFTIIPIEYPYAPIEMSLLNFACIGLPGLVLALEPNTARIKNQFVKNIINYSVPVGITVSTAMVTLAIVAHLNNFPRPELLTASLFVTFAIDLAMLYQISKPLNFLRTSLLLVIIAIVVGAFCIPYTRNLLDLGFLSPNALVITISLVCLSLLLFLLLRHLPKPKSLLKH
jgi:cation-transporting ATPase E